MSAETNVNEDGIYTLNIFLSCREQLVLTGDCRWQFS